MVVAFAAFALKFELNFFCFCFDNLKTFALVSCGLILQESFCKMICYIFLVCDFQIIVREAFCRSIVILPVIFQIICHTFFGFVLPLILAT